MTNNLKGELVLMDSMGIKPNYAQLAKKYGMDWRTVKKYDQGYEGKPNTRSKKGRLDVHSVEMLDPQTLITNCRNAQNSLWIAYNGFGCTYGARGQAVYAKNLFDGRESRWERADFLGVVKPESLQKWLDDMPVRNEVAHSAAHEAEKSVEQEDGYER